MSTISGYVPRRYSATGGTGNVGKVTIIAAALALAFLFGLVAITANPIAVAVASSLVIGALLFVRPTWTIWLMVISGLLIAGLLPVWAEGLGSRTAWGISILGFVLMGKAAFTVATEPRATNGTASFIWLALIFFLYALVVSLLNWQDPFELLAGVKRYFQAFGLMFTLAWISIDDRSVVHWRRLIVWVAVLQLPFAVYQLVELVPIRQAISSAYPKMVPIDVVAGTFGSTLYSGGASAEMAAFLIIVLTFLVARFRARVISLRRLLLIAPLLIAPLLLGETKIVVVALPLVFLVIYKSEILARPHVALVGIIAGLLLSAATGYVYLGMLGKSVEGQYRKAIEYNFGDRGYGGAYLNRTTVISHWAREQELRGPISAVLGNGLGSSHDTTGGNVSLRYPGYSIGLTAASMLLWDLGLVGFCLFLAILTLAWRTAGELRRNAAPTWVRADATGIQCAIAIFAICLFYRTAILETLSFQIIFALLLGYLAWLHRRGYSAQRISAAT